MLIKVDGLGGLDAETDDQVRVRLAEHDGMQSLLLLQLLHSGNLIGQHLVVFHEAHVDVLSQSACDGSRRGAADVSD